MFFNNFTAYKTSPQDSLRLDKDQGKKTFGDLI